MWSYYQTGLMWLDDIDARLELVDMVSIEMYDLRWLYPQYGMIDFGKYMLANHPNIPLGLVSNPCLPPIYSVNNQLYFWTWAGQQGPYDPVNDPVPDIAESLDRQRKYMGALRDGIRQGGTSPFVNYMTETLTWVNHYPPMGIAETETDVELYPNTTPKLGVWRKYLNQWVMSEEMLTPYPNPRKTTSLTLGIA
jgi:hypothetical protein